jgi:4-oxalocrotonate tautomerase
MPVLHLQLSPPAPQAHAALARELTALTARLLHKRPEVTAVLVEDVPAGGWFIGGDVPAQPTASLCITVTAGTNTEGEKAAFVAAAFAALQARLAPGGTLAPASYVRVQELPAGDWGYGGVTQQQRRADAQATAAA